jgi:hypothetical protein
MPNDSGIGKVSNISLGVNQVVNLALVNRKRLRALIALAFETVTWLESKGLQLGEQCAFREIVEKIWFTPKEK